MIYRRKITHTHKIKSIYIVMMCIALLNGMMCQLIYWNNDDEQFAISPFFLFAMLSVLMHIIKQPVKTTQFYYLSIVVLLIFSIIPSSTVAWLGVLIVALLNLLSKKHKVAGDLLFVALPIAFLWKSLLFKLFAGQLLTIESLAMTYFLSFLHPDVQVINNLITINQSHALLISTGCSLFSNLCLILLCWLSVYTLFSNSLPLFKRLSFVVLMSVFINFMRIFVMSFDYDSYLYMHGSQGSLIIELCLLILLLSAIPTNKKESAYA